MTAAIVPARTVPAGTAGREGEDAYIGLGSNLGDSAAILGSAVEAIAQLPETALLATSSLYRSAPIDADGDDYLNAVVRVRTRLTPTSLLAALQAIEARHGRQRPYANAPRRLDLDLLLHGERTVRASGLVLPHPRLAERAFVLHPLLEIAPDLRLDGAPLCARLAGVAGQRIAKLDR